MSRTTCGLAQIGLLVALVGLAGCPTGNPVLTASPLALSFGTDGTESAFQIRNLGEGVLSWQLATNVDWVFLSQRAGDASVIVEEGTTTSEVDTIEVRVVRSGLSAGTHSGEIQITSDGGNAVIRVSLLVAAPATLNASPDTLDLGTAQTRATFILSNEGTQTLNWTLSIPGSAGWLTANPASGRLSPGQQTVEVQASRAGRNAGAYATDVTVTAGTLTATVHVTMEVLARLLVVDPLELDFGTSGVERTFSVQNAGAQSLVWRVATDDPAFPGYVTVSPSSGTTTTETDTVTVQIDRDAAGFAYGSHNEVPITVTSDEGGGTATVTLVISVGAFSVTPAELDFGTDSNQETLTLQNHGTAAINWTASEASAWITQVTPPGTAPVGGTSDIVVTVDRTGLTPGDYEAVLTVASANHTEQVPVYLTIPPPPRLVATPSSLDFRTDQMDKVVAIWNDGSGTVTWRLDASEFPSWLSVLFNGVSTETQDLLQGTLTGQQTDSLRVSANRSGLAPGTLTASMVITATDQGGNALESRTITVTMTVAAHPVLGVDTGGEVNQLSLGGETVSLPMTLANLGTGTLTWSIGADTLPAWLTIAPLPLSGVIEDNARTRELTVSVSRTGLDSGDYEHSLVITGTENSVTVRIVMTVPSPVLALDPSALEMGTSQTNAPVTLRNAGGGNLKWNTQIAQDFSWLTVSPQTGTTVVGTPAALTVTVNRSALAPGDHEGYVDFLWNDGNRTRLHVLLTVPGPVLSVTPSSLTFTVADTTTVLTVTNTGDRSRPLTWSISELPLPWTSVDQSVGTTTRESDPVVVTISRSRLVQGTYTGNLVFTSNGGEQTIPVTMTVGPFSVDPAELVFGSIDDTLSFRIENHSLAPLAWTVGENAGWLAAAPQSGATAVGARSTVVATVTRGALPTQWYETAVSLGAPALDFELDLPVRMRVAGFELTPDSVSLGEISGTASGTFNIHNISTESLTTAAAVTSGASWLSIAAGDEEQTTEPTGTSAVGVTANPSGLIPGDYAGEVTVTQGLDSDTVAVTMTVPAPPQLTVSPTTLNFGTVLTDRLVAVWNSGVGTVTWTIDTTGFPSWLGVSRTGGSVPDATAATQSIVVSVDRRGITPPASLAYDIVVTGSDQDAHVLTPRTIHVGVSVAAVPVLTVETNPPAWDANSTPILTLGEESATGEFRISNTGTGTLNWQIDTTAFPAWLSIVEPVQGSAPAGAAATSLHVAVNRFGLASGDHSHEVVIASNGGDSTLRVVMTVPRPVLRLSPESLSFGEDGTTSTFTITNGGGDVLEWSLAVPEDVTWLTAVHRDTGVTSGATPIGVDEVITVTINRQGQQSGDHHAELLINSNGGNKTLPITMTVPGPRLSVSPQSLAFAPDDVQKTLTVQNTGDAARTLIWSIDEGYPHWLSVNMERGAVVQQPNVVEVTVDRSGLTAGVHEGDVSFTSNGGSATVHVSMEVPRFTLSPESVEIGGRTATATFLVENHADASLDWAASVAWASWNAPVSDWLEVIPNSGTIPINARATLTIRVISRDDLAPGWYEGPIAIQDTTTEDEDYVNVRVRVATFAVAEPTVLDFGTIDAEASDTFAINNNSAAPVEWTATVAPGASWLTVDPSSGAVDDSETVTVTVSPASLSPGAYNGTITVTSGDDTDTVIVQMRVPTPPTLAAAPTSMDFGTTTLERLLAIWNSGADTVNWRIDTSGFPAWLSLTPVSGDVAEGSVSGSDTDTVTLRVDRDGMTPSTTPYSHEFVVTATDDGGASLNSLTVRVQMSVVGMPSIEVDTGSVDQTGVAFINLGTTLTQAAFTIRNVGTGTLTWSIGTTNFPAWMTSIAPSQGSIAPGRQTTVTLTVDRTGLGFGGYEHVLVVGANDIENRTVPVSVQLQVPKKVVIGLRSTTLAFDQITNSSSFDVSNVGDSGSVLDFILETNKEWLFFFPATGQSIGTSSDVKDWQTMDVSIDRTKLDGTGSTGQIVIHAYALDENMNVVLLDGVVEPRTIQVSVVAAPLSFEAAGALTRVPSLVRIPMLMRDLQYRAIPLPTDQLDTYAGNFSVFEKDVPLEISETNQLLKDASRLRTDVAILLDYSGSMFEAAQLIDDDPAFDEFAVSHPSAPLDKLQALYEYYVGRLILQLPDNYRIAILEFHERLNPVVTRPNLVFRFTTDKAALLDQLRSISVQDHGASEVLTEMMSASSFLASADSPYVPLHDPEASAYYVPFETADVSALIMISDGRVTTPPAKIKDATSWLSARRTRLFAIGWGTDVNHEPLARVASATGGHYYSTRTVPLTDANGDPVTDPQGNPILLPSTTELAEYCFSEEPCEQSIAGDLESQVVFSYVTLNEEAGVKMRIAATFDDPNDDEGTCGLEDQRVISGNFTQKVDFAGFAGDVNLGQISMHTDGIQDDGSAAVVLRADYIPRNIHVFEFEVWSTAPFTLSRAGADDAGLVWSWNVQQWNTGAGDWDAPLADPDDLASVPRPVTGVPWLRLRVSSPDDTPLLYGEFGDLFEVDFAGVGGTFTLNLFVDNDAYLDSEWPYEDKYFIYPNAIEVNEDGRRAPAFPTPLLTRISPVHDYDVLNTFQLEPTDSTLEFSIMNIGGTFPYLSEEPAVVLNWRVGDLPAYLKLPEGDHGEGILRGGVGDTDTQELIVDRDQEADSYYGTIGVEYSHVYGSGVAGINVWLDILPPGMDVTDEVGTSITEVDLGDALEEGGFYVVNTGQSTLSWALSVYDDTGALVDELPDWLTLSKTSGDVPWSDPDPPYDPEDDPETVLISLDRETAPEGSFLYTFVVTGTDDRGEPVAGTSTFDVEVRGDVLPPQPAVTGAPVDFGATATTATIQVSNSGNRVLYWEIDRGTLPAWLSVSLASGTIAYGDAATTVALTVNRTTAPASFSHTFQVFGRDADASGPPVEPLAGVDVAVSGTNPP